MVGCAAHIPQTVLITHSRRAAQIQQDVLHTYGRQCWIHMADVLHTYNKPCFSHGIQLDVDVHMCKHAGRASRCRQGC